MVEIELKVKGKAIELLQIPANWQELGANQLLYIAEKWQYWRFLIQNRQSLLREKALLFVELMVGNTFWNKKKRVELIKKLQNEELYALTQLTNFVFEANKLTICPLSAIGNDYITLHAPNNGLTNITVIELHFADKFYLQYTEHKMEKHLDLLICCLYRPKEKGKESRLPFDKNEVEKYESIISKLPAEKKQLILIWYIGCRTWMIESNRGLFNGGGDGKVSTDGWLPIILELSGDKFGTFDETGQMDFYVIAMELKRLQKINKPK